LWFGGGELYTYAVGGDSRVTLIDHVLIDLNRYGIPKIDQHKMPLPPAKGPAEVMKTAAVMPKMPASAVVDTSAASDRLLSKPPPSQ
jgi:hypothetical protein